MAQEITISGTTIPTPQEFHIERYNLTKAGRVATGDMKMDLIAKKRKFLLRYRVLSGTQLNNILTLIDGPGIVFFTVGYIENGVTKTAICYAGHIPSHLFRTDGKWYWRDVNFDLIEV